MQSCFSRVQLFVTLWTVAHQAPLSMEFSRQKYWSGSPCPPPGHCPNPGIKPESLMSPALAGRFFTTRATSLGLAHLNSFTFKLSTNVFAPLWNLIQLPEVEPLLNFNILLYVLLTWSVCAPITQLDREPWETRDHSPLVPQGFTHKRQVGICHRCQQTKQQWDLAWASSVAWGCKLFL